MLFYSSFFGWTGTGGVLLYNGSNRAAATMESENTYS